jgi:hypothetical protein
MDIWGILTIAGVVISLIFGIVGTYLAVRKHQYPGELTFVNGGEVSLFEEIVRNLENLQIRYKNENIERNIILLKGALINSGSIDITKDKIAEPLTAILPDEYQWLEAKIISSSPGLIPQLNIKNPQQLIFDLGLFRRNESISFQALIKVPYVEKDSKPEYSLKNDLHFHHRIAETKNDVKTTIYRSSIRSKDYLLYLSLMITIVSMLIALLVKFLDPRGIIAYEISRDNKNIELVNIIPNINGLSEIKGINSKFEENISFDDFFIKYKPKPILYKDTSTNTPIIVALLCYMVLGLGMFTYIKVTGNERKKLKKLFNVDFDEYESMGDFSSFGFRRKYRMDLPLRILNYLIEYENKPQTVDEINARIHWKINETSSAIYKLVEEGSVYKSTYDLDKKARYFITQFGKDQTH